MQKTTYVFPIIGGRKVEHLLANVEALSIVLTDEHIKYIESVVEFDPGFPNTMIVSLTNYSQRFSDHEWRYSREATVKMVGSSSPPCWRGRQRCIQSDQAPEFCLYNIVPGFLGQKFLRCWCADLSVKNASSLSRNVQN